MGSLGGEEREQLWPERIAMVEVWKRIQEKNSGFFPVVVLEPESGGAWRQRLARDRRFRGSDEQKRGSG